MLLHLGGGHGGGGLLALALGFGLGRSGGGLLPPGRTQRLAEEEVVLATPEKNGGCRYVSPPARGKGGRYS